MAKDNMPTGPGSVPGMADAKKDNKEKQGSVFGSAKQGKSSMSASKGDDGIYISQPGTANLYAQERNSQASLDGRVRAIVIIVIALVACFALACILPTNVFSSVYRTDSSIATYLEEMQAQFGGLISFFTGADTLYSIYIWELVAALLAGAALGLSGGVYQGALKNALASPSTLGVTSGGALGSIIYAVTMYRGEFNGSAQEYSQYLEELDLLSYMAELYGSFLCSLLGCFLVVALILAISVIAGHGKVSNVSLIIAGQVFVAIINVVLVWVRYYLEQTSGNADVAQFLTANQTITFSGAYNLQSVAMFAIPLMACMAVVFMQSSKLSLLAFNDDEARSMGISTAKTRYLTVGLCTALTALVIPFCGPVGFVGFIAPHVARRLVGPDFKYLLPASALIGALVVICAHYVSTMGIPGLVAGSTGVITSVVGCGMFIVMAFRTKGERRGEWF